MRPMDDAAVRTAVEKVAAAFTGVVMIPSLSGLCTCHDVDESEFALLAAPDVPISLELADRVARNMMDPGDPSASVPRVLPQLVAAVAAGESHDPGRSMRGLAFAQWTEWPPDKSGPVMGFLEAWFRWAVRNGDAYRPAEVFVACTVATLSPGHWIGLWERDHSRAAVRRLAGTVSNWVTELVYWSSASLLDPNDDDADREMETWLSGAAVDRMVELGAPPELVRWMRLLRLPEAERDTAEHWADALPLEEFQDVVGRWLAGL